MGGMLHHTTSVLSKEKNNNTWIEAVVAPVPAAPAADDGGVEVGTAIVEPSHDPLLIVA